MRYYVSEVTNAGGDTTIERRCVPATARALRYLGDALTLRSNIIMQISNRTEGSQDSHKPSQ
jgi:hypothetical protein